MRQLALTSLLLLCTTCFAQTHSAPTSNPSLAPVQWGSVAATTRFPGTGLSLAYGQQDLLAPGTDARFGVRYLSDLYYGYAGNTPSFSLELHADALAYTYDPDPTQSLALVAYGGLGPRLLLLAGVPNYEAIDYNDPAYYEDPSYVTPTMNAYLINLGGIGGLEARLGRFGIFLEVDLSLPLLGLIGPRLRAMPFDTGTSAGLTIGSSYYF